MEQRVCGEERIGPKGIERARCLRGAYGVITVCLRGREADEEERPTEKRRENYRQCEGERKSGESNDRDDGRVDK